MEVAAKLIEIKAGLTTLVDNRLVSDSRKGQIQVIRVSRWASSMANACALGCEVSKRIIGLEFLPCRIRMACTLHMV